MEKQIKETEWGKLSDPVKTILERVDINRKDADLIIGEEINIPYFKGIVTEEIAEELVKYQHSNENEGYFSAMIEGKILKIKFLRQGF
ncbi:hypothetical protein [Brevibacillus sp. NRS-1366]|uniref:hypothetical protein n=1 Tax=Brevibacillus sp. NRS-1366 TaxID=3233899 RepID=UPI003D20B88A